MPPGERSGPAKAFRAPAASLDIPRGDSLASIGVGIAMVLLVFFIVASRGHADRRSSEAPQRVVEAHSRCVAGKASALSPERVRNPLAGLGARAEPARDGEADGLRAAACELAEAADERAKWAAERSIPKALADSASGAFVFAGGFAPRFASALDFPAVTAAVRHVIGPYWRPGGWSASLVSRALSASMTWSSPNRAGAF